MSDGHAHGGDACDDHAHDQHSHDHGHAHEHGHSHGGAPCTGHGPGSPVSLTHDLATGAVDVDGRIAAPSKGKGSKGKAGAGQAAAAGACIEGPPMCSKCSAVPTMTAEELQSACVHVRDMTDAAQSRRCC